MIQFSHLYVTVGNAYKQTPGQQIYRDEHVLTCLFFYVFLTQVKGRNTSPLVQLT